MTEVVGLVLAGGYGKRLKPLTNSAQKCALPIDGGPPVVRAMRKLNEIHAKKKSLYLDIGGKT